MMILVILAFGAFFLSWRDWQVVIAVSGLALGFLLIFGALAIVLDSQD